VGRRLVVGAVVNSILYVTLLSNSLASTYHTIPGHCFHTGQGPCRANMHKWGLASYPLCDCREQLTMAHIDDSCPITKLDGGLLSLHEAEDDAISWLKMTATKALVK